MRSIITRNFSLPLKLSATACCIFAAGSSTIKPVDPGTLALTPIPQPAKPFTKEPLSLFARFAQGQLPSGGAAHGGSALSG